MAYFSPHFNDSLIFEVGKANLTNSTAPQSNGGFKNTEFVNPPSGKLGDCWQCVVAIDCLSLLLLLSEMLSEKGGKKESEKQNESAKASKWRTDVILELKDVEDCDVECIKVADLKDSDEYQRIIMCLRYLSARIRFSMSFNADEKIATVTVIQACDVPGADLSGLSDPYAKCAIVPAGKKEFKTKVKMKTVNPVFDQTFNFKHITYAQLTSSYLHMKVFDYDRFSGHDMLGEAKVPIIDLDLTRPIDEWRILQPEFKMETKGMKKGDPKLGHICISLAYAPNPQLLAVFILACKDLKSTDDDGYSDPYVKFWLIQEGKKVKKRKTSVKIRTLNPSYNESFLFEVDFEKIEETSLMFIVCDYDKGEIGDPIGELLLGSLGTGAQLKHWTKMRRTPGKPVARWHRLRPPTASE
eukprot:gene12748-14054_t